MTLKTPSMRLTALLAALAAASAFSGCAPLVIGGAMVGGSMMAVDRRTSGVQVDDQSIELKSIRRINEVMGDRGFVSVTSYNRVVLLTGQVPTDADKTTVEQAVSRIEGVRSIVNELALTPSVATFINHSNDTLITSKVKASLIDAKDVQSGAFKVITERSVVYLMGRVTEREATRAADVARGVSGVQKVVRVFEVVTEAELAELVPKPAPAPAKP
jgi:osmotically-inducible protein OsmY